jgi:sugar lactone lactonase YvrE
MRSTLQHRFLIALLLSIAICARLVAAAEEGLNVTTVAGKKPWPGKDGEQDRIAPCIASDRDDNVFVCTYRGTGSIIWELSAKGDGLAIALIDANGRLIRNPTVSLPIRLVGEKITFRRDGMLTIQNNDGFGFVDQFVAPQMATEPPRPVGLLVGSDKTLFISTAPITSDAKGDIYVAGPIVERISPDGTVTKLAGYSQGSRDGTGPDAQFNRPAGIASDAAGNLLVADTLNCTIRRITPTGVVTTIAGRPGELGDNDGKVDGSADFQSRAHFSTPSGIAIKKDGVVLVADTAGIRQILPNGVVSTFAGRRDPENFNRLHAGWKDGPVLTAEFDSPAAISVSPSGVIFVADTGQVTGRGTIRRVAFGPIVDSSTQSGPGTQKPAHSRKITAGEVVTLAHGLGRIGPLLIDASGDIYFGVRGDLWTGTVQRLKPNGERTIVVGRTGQYAPDEHDNSHRFLSPTGLAIDRSGTLYVADSERDDIVEITPDGTMYRAQDRTGSALSSGWGLAISPAGALFVSRNFAQVVYRVTPDGRQNAFAGVNGAVGEVDGRGDEARFNNPRLIAVDSHENVYVGENSKAIRRIAPDGTVVTIAGKPDQEGIADGRGEEARFTDITGIAVGPDDTAYVCDAGRIRAVSPDGNVETVLENHASGQDSSPDAYDHAPVPVGRVKFVDLGSIVIDRVGCLYVTDGGSIRKITATP